MSQEKITHCNYDNFEQTVLINNCVALVDFWAPWCSHCLMISPIIDQINEEYADKVKVVKINTDKNSEIVKEYQIMSLPTILFFKDGKVVKRVIGAKPKNEITKILDELL